jgi:hypothetical protein
MHKKLWRRMKPTWRISRAYWPKPKENKNHSFKRSWNLPNSTSKSWRKR